MIGGTAGLVVAAETLLRPAVGPETTLGAGLRTRVAAILLRLALEQRLADFWQGAVPGMSRIVKHRILCLEGYTDRETARRCYLTWSALSAAAHHRAYELPPHPAEIRVRLREVKALLEDLGPADAVPARAAVPSPGRPAGQTAVPAATRVAGAARRAPRPGPPPGRRATPRAVGNP